MWLIHFQPQLHPKWVKQSTIWTWPKSTVFFCGNRTPPPKKQIMGFCHKNGDFTLNTMKNLRLFFHLSTFRISPTRGYDRCLLVCSQSTGFFICRYKPFTIYNKPVFFYGFYIYIYLWDITVYWYV